jgi:predicted nucleic acid-binding protein
VRRPVLLDASFLIALEQETEQRNGGAARRFLLGLRGRPLVVSVVTVEEILVQRRASHRLSENDAWLVATADVLDADVVGADRAAFERLGRRYLRFRS